MRRPVILLLLLVLAGFGAAVGAYYCGAKICCQRMYNASDELDWLRHEFRLNETEMQRIRQLHEGYLPQCGQMCLQIHDRTVELQGLLASTNGITPAVDQKLAEIGTLRARCQAQMLRHFEDVSRAMPADQGRRYLEEMKQFTLGFHAQIERNMSNNPHAAHGQH